MAIFGLFRNRNAEKLQRLQQKAAILEAKAKILRAKNAMSTSESKASAKKITNLLDNVDNLNDLKTKLAEVIPDKQHPILQALENPQVQMLITHFIGGGITVSEREKKIADFLNKNPSIAEKVEAMLK